MTALRVLSTPELLNLILEPHDHNPPEHKRSLLAMAMTSKALKELALDALWSDLDSVIPLVLLLCKDDLELRNLSEGGQEFVWVGHIEYFFILYQSDYPIPNIFPHRMKGLRDTGITSEGWSTFMNYNYHVKRICIVTDALVLNDWDPFELDRSVLPAIASTQPFAGPLLPNLRSMCIFSDCLYEFKSCLPFLGKAVQNLTLSVGHGLTCPALRKITSRLPHLKTLSLVQSPTNQTKFEKELAQAIQSLGTEELTLPQGALTPAMLNKLSQIRSLKKVSAYWSDPEYASDAAPTGTLNSLQQGSFPQLAKLDIATSLTIAAKLMACEGCFSHLVELGVYSSDSSSYQLGEFSQILAQHRPHIASIRLKFSLSSSPANPLPFSSLAPLLACHEITSSTLQHRSAIRMDLNGLKQMLEHWPKLINLKITTIPSSETEESTLAFSMVDSLNLFGNLCPSIEEIELPFDVSDPLPWPSELRLENIKFLHVGKTRPNSPDIALFLGELCNHSMSIIKDPPGDSWHAAPRRDINRWNVWEGIERYFKSHARQRERGIAQVREKECLRNPGWKAVVTKMV